MLAALLEIPASADDWSRWTWNNAAQVALINRAIQRKYNVFLPKFILFPLAMDQPGIWLQNNSEAHTNFNGVLGLQGVDLLTVDFNDPDATAAWVTRNYQELYDASTALKI